MEEMDLAKKEKEEEMEVSGKSIHTAPDSEVVERPHEELGWLSPREWREQQKQAA